MNIISIIQKEIDGIFLKDYGWDEDCPPIFKVFDISGKQLSNQRIIITCEHLGSQIGVDIYPDKNSVYGLDSLENIMRNLYNRTM